MDFGNVVFQDRHAVALIDFDFASPSDPVWEVAVAAYYLVPLGKSDTSRCSHHDVVPDRLRILTNACRLDTTVKETLWDAVFAFHRWRHERTETANRLTEDWLARHQNDTQWLATSHRLIPNI